MYISMIYALVFMTDTKGEIFHMIIRVSPSRFSALWDLRPKMLLHELP